MPVPPLIEQLRKELVLSEVDGIRHEVQNRSSAQHALTSLHLTFVSLTAGFASRGGSAWNLFLLIPAITPFFGLLYLDHHTTIARLSARLEAYYRIARLPTYQGESIEERSTWRYWVLFATPATLIFIGAPITALLLTWGSVTSKNSWISGGWIVEVCWTFLFTVFAVDVLRHRPEGSPVIADELWDVSHTAQSQANDSEAER